jgi:hypothetical protein
MLQVQQKEMGVAAAVAITKDWKKIAKEKMNYNVDECPCCKKARPDDLVGLSRMQAILHFDANAPPPVWILKKMAAQKNITAQ